MGNQYRITPEMLYEQTKQQAITINELQLQVSAVLTENAELRVRVEELTSAAATDEPDGTSD